MENSRTRIRKCLPTPRVEWQSKRTNKSSSSFESSAGILASSAIRPIHSHELSVQVSALWQHRVDATGLSDEITVHFAGNNAFVSCSLRMQANKMLAVDRYQNPALVVREGKHFLVRPGVFCLARFLDGNDIVAKAAQFFDDGKGDVFVGVQAGHFCSPR